MDSEDLLDLTPDLFDDEDLSEGQYCNVMNHISNHNDSPTTAKICGEKQTHEFKSTELQESEATFLSDLASSLPEGSSKAHAVIGSDIDHQGVKDTEEDFAEEGLSSKRQKVCKSEYAETWKDSEEVIQIGDSSANVIEILDSENSNDEVPLSATHQTCESHVATSSDSVKNSVHESCSVAKKADSNASLLSQEASINTSHFQRQYLDADGEENLKRNDDDSDKMKLSHFSQTEQVFSCSQRFAKEQKNTHMLDGEDSPSQQKEPSRAEDLELTCPFCGVREVSLYRLEFHVETTHAEFSSADVQGANTSSDFTKFSNSNLAEDDDPFRFICPLCDLDLGDEESLNLHLNTMHEDEQPEEAGGTESCPLCGLSCLSETDMKEHIKTHMDDPTYHGISTAGDSKSLDEGVTSATSLTLREMVCPVCGLAMADADLLTSHVESHFNPQHSTGGSWTTGSVKKNGSRETVSAKSQARIPDKTTQKPVSSTATSHSSQDNLPSSSKGKWTPPGSRENGSYRKQYEESLEKAVMRGQLTATEYHEMKSQMVQKDLRGVDDGRSRTQGLIERLRALYRSQARPGQVVHLSASTDHYSGSYGDKGWGCGYRNLQMLLSALSRQPDYARRIFTDNDAAIPSIPKIQQMIEAAWERGFDPQGCAQLRGRLVNTRKWIGATEIVATLSSLGVKCRLADFHAPTSSDGTHPRLLEWVLDYFSHNQQEFVPPLYLQHQGHSRTIVGVENDRGTVKLLLFDPGTSHDHMASQAKGPLGWKHMRTFRRTQAGFRAKQYQIVAVTGLLTDAEYQGSKTLKSERVS